MQKTICTLLCLLLLVVGCASQPISSPVDAPGFFSGLLHGAIGLATLIGSIFLEVRIYSFPNSGVGYDFGFVIGLFAVQSFLFLFLLYFVANATEIIGGFLQIIVILSLLALALWIAIFLILDLNIVTDYEQIPWGDIIGYSVLSLTVLFFSVSFLKFLYEFPKRRRELKEHNAQVEQGRELLKGIKVKSEVEGAIRKYPGPVQRELLDEWLRGEGGDGWS